MAFFHGVETINVPSSTQPAAAVETAVIGLVGVAPIGSVNTMKLCASKQDDEQFGGNLYPMSINRSLDHIRREDPAAKVIVVNVYDPSTVSTTITEEAVTIVNGKATLDYPVLSEAATPVVGGGSPWATFVAGTDYTINEYGVLTIIPSGDIAEGDTVYVTYDTFDVSGLAAADFVGTTSPKTGFKLFDEAYDTFGFAPKIFVCPEYSSIDAVANEMETQCSTFRARCYVDDVNNTSRADLITHRTTAGNSSATTSTRVIPCGPWVQDYDYLGVLADYPLSAVAAGIHSRTARVEGYWVSPSNKVSNVIVKPEYPMVGTGPNDQAGDVQLLNAAGIYSIVKVGGSYRSYGNRSAAYPTSTAPENFIAVQHLDDIVSETIEKTLIPFIDKPLVQATIDAILATANAYLSSVIQAGGLLPGSKVYYDPADNPAVDLAAGKIVFRRVYAGAVPAERITMKSTFDITLLTQLS
jgi:phage tail sheath protein FI